MNDAEKVGKEKDDEIRHILESYERVLDVWKVQNDTYFRRVQLLMGVLQAGLFVATLQQLSPLPTSGRETVVPGLLGVIGILSGGLWLAFIRRQAQYFELSRRTLRNLEVKLANLKVPLQYFIAESWVFSPLRKENEFPKEPLRHSIELKSDSIGRHFVKFKTSEEHYPKPSCRKGRYSLGEVEGGMIDSERLIAVGVMFVWFVLVLAAAWFGLAQLLPVLLAACVLLLLIVGLVRWGHRIFRLLVKLLP